RESPSCVARCNGQVAPKQAAPARGRFLAGRCPQGALGSIPGLRFPNAFLLGGPAMLLHRGRLLFVVLFTLAASLPVRSEPPGKRPSPRLDRCGDPLPEGAIARMGSLRWHHGAMIHCIAFSPDGKLLASGGPGSTVRVWVSSTGRAVRQLNGQFERVRSVAFSPDGKLLGTAGGRIILWEVATGRQICQLGEGGNSLAFSSDGKILAAAADWNQRVSLWEVSTGK